MTENTVSTQFPDETKTIASVLEEFSNAASVEAVYGAAIQQGETIVIPSAEVISFMGFGMGSGSGSGENNQVGGAGGGGGGGRMFSRPVAAIIIQGDHVRVEPVVDVTKIALALFTTIGFITSMIWRMSRRRLKV